MSVTSFKEDSSCGSLSERPPWAILAELGASRQSGSWVLGSFWCWLCCFPLENSDQPSKILCDWFPFSETELEEIFHRAIAGQMQILLAEFFYFQATKYTYLVYGTEFTSPLRRTSFVSCNDELLFDIHNIVLHCLSDGATQSYLGGSEMWQPTWCFFRLHKPPSRGRRIWHGKGWLEQQRALMPEGLLELGRRDALWKFAAFIMCCQRKNLQPERMCIMDAMGGDWGDYWSCLGTA